MMTVSKILECFAELADLSGEEAEKHKTLVEITARAIESKLRKEIDAEADMDLLAYFAASVVFYRYMEQKAATTEGENVTINGISIQNNIAKKRDAACRLKDDLFGTVKHMFLPDDLFFFCRAE